MWAVGVGWDGIVLGGSSLQRVKHDVVTCYMMLGDCSPPCGVIAFISQALIINRVIEEDGGGLVRMGVSVTVKGGFPFSQLHSARTYFFSPTLHQRIVVWSSHGVSVAGGKCWGGGR